MPISQRVLHASADLHTSFALDGCLERRGWGL